MRWYHYLGIIAFFALMVAAIVGPLIVADFTSFSQTSIFDTYAIPLSGNVWLSGDVLPLRRWYRVNTGEAVLLLCAAEYTSDYRTVLVQPGASSAECDGQ